MENSTKTALLVGGLAAAGLGIFLYTKKSSGAGAQTKPKGGPQPTGPYLPDPAKPTIAAPVGTPGTKPVVAVPAPGTTVIGTVPPAPKGVTFNEVPQANKVALWQAITPFQFDMSQSASNMFALTTTPASEVANSAATTLMNKNNTQGGDGLYILTSSDGANYMFYAAAESDAVAQASGPGAVWAVYLRPNEWVPVAEAAYEQTITAQGAKPETPAGFDMNTLGGYLSKVPNPFGA